MPISRSDFDAGELSVEGFLLAFLRENEDLAFRAEELLTDSNLRVWPRLRTNCRTL